MNNSIISIYKKLAISSLLLALCMQYTPDIYAQTYSCVQYSSEQGLYSTLVKSSIKDSLGFVWVATDNGLYKYNGNNFNHVKDSIPEGFTKNLSLLSNNRIWACTDKGIVEIIQEYYGANVKRVWEGRDSLSQQDLYYPKTLFEDSKHRIWISDHASIWMKSEKDVIRHDIAPEDGSRNYLHSASLAESSDGKIWMCTQTGKVFQYNEVNKEFVHLKQIAQLPSAEQIITTSMGTLWICTASGIAEISNTGDIENIQLKYINKLADVSCIATVSDNEWLAGTWNNGLYRIVATDNGFVTIPLQALQTKNVNHIFVASPTEYWISTDDGLFLILKNFFSHDISGIQRLYIHEITSYDSTTLLSTDGTNLYQITTNTQQPYAQIIYTDKNESLLQIERWAQDTLLTSTTQGSLYWISNGKIVHTISKIENESSLFSFHKSNDSTLWICQENLAGILCLKRDKTIQVYNEKSGIKSKILVVKQSTAGTLYAAGIGKDTYLYRKELESFVNISLPNTQLPESFSVNDILLWNEDSIYLGTSDGLFLQTANLIQKILPRNNDMQLIVKSIARDQYGTIWMGTQLGISRWWNATHLRFSEKEGLNGSAISFRALKIDTQNRLWVATSTGICISNPIQAPAITPTPYFKTIEFNNKQSTTDTQIHEGDHAFFGFTSLTYPSENILYSIRLTDYYDQWYTLPKPELTLPHLPAGEFTLEVRALQSGNYTWSNPLVYKMVVYKNWYNTIWFMALIAGIFICLVIVLYRYNQKRLLNQKRMLEKEIAQRVKELSVKNEILEKAVTGLRQTQKKLQEREKMASLGQMAAGVVHELKNPLNFISLSSGILVSHLQEIEELALTYFRPAEKDSAEFSDQYKDDWIKYEALKSEISTLLHSITTGVKQSNEIISGLQIFARNEEHINTETDINQLIDSSFALLQNEYKLRVNVQKKFGKIPPFLCNQGKLGQAFVNILLNAIQAIDEKGTITVTTFTEQGWIKIRITDTGSGMATDVLSRAFDPFFTTKDPGNHSGLGLSVSQSFIEQHQGKVDIKSTKGVGTELTIRLPLSLKQTT